MWKVKTKNGKEVSELDTKWNNIKDDISELLLVTKNGQVINLPKNCESYVQFKTASAEIGKKDIQIESRTIGFRLGNNTIKIRVDEKTSNINIEVENG